MLGISPTQTISIVIVMVLVSLSLQQRSASGVPLPQAEQQQIHIAVVCTEAVSQNYYYGNITTITDENILAQCDDLFVDLKNQCDAIGFSPSSESESEETEEN